MGYQVRPRKIEPGKYQLSYGRGARRITAMIQKVANRKWSIDVLPLSSPPSMAVAKMNFHEWAVSRYGGHGAASTPAAVARLLNPLGPAEAGHARESAPERALTTTLSLDEGDDPDPIAEFQPANDFERGLLAAARCVTSHHCLTLTRSVLAERILKLGVLDHTPAELLAQEVRQLLLDKPARGRHAAQEVAHA